MSDFYTDLQAIKHLVNHSTSEDEARERFLKMQGFGLDMDTAHRAFDQAVGLKFSKQKATASFVKRVAERAKG